MKYAQFYAEYERQLFRCAEIAAYMHELDPDFSPKPQLNLTLVDLDETGAGLHWFSQDEQDERTYVSIESSWMDVEDFRPLVQLKFREWQKARDYFAQQDRGKNK